MEHCVGAGVLSERFDTTGNKCLADTRPSCLWNYVDAPDIAVLADSRQKQIRVETGETLTGNTTHVGIVLYRKEHAQAVATLALFDKLNYARFIIFDNVSLRLSNIEPHLAKHLG